MIQPQSRPTSDNGKITQSPQALMLPEFTLADNAMSISNNGPLVSIVEQSHDHILLRYKAMTIRDYENTRYLLK